MDTMIYLLCKVLDASLNWVIFFAAILETIILIISWNKLIVLKDQIDMLNHATRKRAVNVRRDVKKVTTEYVTTFERDWNAFDQFCDDYQREGKWFSAFSLIIQLFTLLGILGTVAGLYIAMHGNDSWNNAQSMYEGVKFALSSTVLGIIFAVIFKCFDIVLNTLFLNHIDDGITRYQNNYTEEKDFPRENHPREAKTEPDLPDLMAEILDQTEGTDLLPEGEPIAEEET